MVLSLPLHALAQPQPAPFVPKPPWTWTGHLGLQTGALGGSAGPSQQGGDALWLGGDGWLGVGDGQWRFWTRLEQRWGWMRRQGEDLDVQKWRDRVAAGGQLAGGGGAGAKAWGVGKDLVV